MPHAMSARNAYEKSFILAFCRNANATTQKMQKSLLPPGEYAICASGVPFSSNACHPDC